MLFLNMQGQLGYDLFQVLWAKVWQSSQGIPRLPSTSRVFLKQKRTDAFIGIDFIVWKGRAGKPCA
jgi:hypothetical protein